MLKQGLGVLQEVIQVVLDDLDGDGQLQGLVVSIFFLFETKINPSAEFLPFTLTFPGKSMFTFCPFTIREVTSFADFKSSSSAFNF